MIDRQRFEEWAQSNIGQFSNGGRYVRDGKWVYHHNIQQLCWEAWQASAKYVRSEKV